MLAFTVLLFDFSSSIIAAENNESSKAVKAQSCTKIELKIQRLVCFDDIFSTPIYGIKKANDKPESWIRAKTSELKRQSGLEPILTVSENTADIWVTMPAVNSSYDNSSSPLLLLSCIGGISRIDLVLSEPVSEGRVNISLGSTSAEPWRSDDSGLVISSGRGTVAIKHIETILSTVDLAIRSNSPLIDGLKFDTRKINEVIEPLRERCGW